MLDTRTVHTGGASDSTSLPGLNPSDPQTGGPSSSDGGTALAQCAAQFGAARSGCDGATIAPGSSCCIAVMALGSECLAMLAEAAGQEGADPGMVSSV